MKLGGTSPLEALTNLDVVTMWGPGKVLAWNQIIRLSRALTLRHPYSNDPPGPFFGSAICCGGGTRGRDRGAARGDCAAGRPGGRVSDDSKHVRGRGRGDAAHPPRVGMVRPSRHARNPSIGRGRSREGVRRCAGY